MEDPMPGTCGIIKSEISEFFTDEWYVAVDGMEAVVNGEANAHLVAAAKRILEALEWALFRSCEDSADCPVIEHREMFDAIAKAKGEAA